VKSEARPLLAAPATRAVVALTDSVKIERLGEIPVSYRNDARAELFGAGSLL